jgi:hypothetical protein
MATQTYLNTLSYRKRDNNDLSFELIIDGSPFGDLIGEPDMPITYWYFLDEGFDRQLPRSSWRDDGRRLIAVCSCGESGCGHVDCLVELGTELVIFKNFGGDTARDRMSDMEFRFSVENYQMVLSDIVNTAREYHQKNPPIA